MNNIIRLVALFILLISLESGALTCKNLLGLDVNSRYDLYDLDEAEGLLRDYTRSGYIEINQELRNSPQSERSIEYARLLGLVLDQLPNYIKDVYRGISAEPEMLNWVDSLNPGDTFIWNAPTSTSQKKSKVGGGLIFTIRSKTGKSVEDFAVYSGVGIREYEVLFKPFTKFRVVKVEIPYKGKINREILIEEME